MVSIVAVFWKPVLFISLNVFLIVWLAIVLQTLILVLGGDDPLTLLRILVADGAFLIIGILLVVLNRYYHISFTNRLLPFLCILNLTLVALLNVTPASLWFGVIVTAALVIICTVLTLRNFIYH